MSDLPNPDTREEIFLRVLADGEGDLPDPVTREERYLYAAATGSEDYPADPHTRKEIYLAAIAENGGGGGGGIDTRIVIGTAHTHINIPDNLILEIVKVV